MGRGREGERKKERAGAEGTERQRVERQRAGQKEREE
jgi:hypothetical protein